MSESVSFLGGAAIAGLAALLLLRGGGNLLSSGSPTFQPSPVPSVAAPPPTLAPSPAIPAAAPAVVGQQEEARKAEVESLKLQLDQQKLEIDKLKYQIQRQDGFIQTIAQARANPQSAQPINPPAAQSQSANNQGSPVLMGILWAAGGATVCLVGGTLLLGAIAAFSRQQSRNRSSPIAYPVNRVRVIPYRRRYTPTSEPYILPPDEHYPSSYPESQPMPRRVEYREYE